MAVDEGATREQLIEQLEAAKQRIAEVEASTASLRKSEARFRKLFENAPLGYQSLDERGHLVEVNETWCELLGYTKTEVLGRSFSEFLHPEFGEHFRRNFPRFKSMGYIIGVEFDMLKKDGEVVAVKIDGRIGLNPDGSFRQTHCVIEDATMRKRAEQALRDSESRLSRAQTVAHVGCWEAVPGSDEDDWWSAEMYRIFRIEPGEVAPSFEAISRLLPPDDQAALRTHFQALIRGDREQLNFEHRVCRPDGSVGWVHALGHVERDASGSPVRLFGTVLDITERKVVETALQNERNKLESIVSAIGHGLTIRDPDYNITYQNQVVEDLFGDRIGEKCYRVYEGEEDICDGCPVKLALEDGQIHTAERAVTMPAGDLAYWENTASPIRDADGKISACLEVNLNVTERKEREASLHQAQRLESLGLLAGGVAHDFNNLLTPILVLAGCALDETGDLDPRQADLAGILHAAERARDLTKQLLAFSRNQVLEMKTVGLGEVIQEHKKSLDRLVREDIEIEVHTKAKESYIRADPSRLGQVLLNLAINGQDAMPDGGTLSIEVSELSIDETVEDEQHEPGPYVTLTIADTGEGMDDETAAKVFDPFYSTKEVGKGTGLGLATVHGIVQQHGGWIEVKTAPGRGTAFELYFPRVEESPRASDSAPRAEAPVTGGTETVLVVEDEEVVRGLAARLLKARGYTVIEAAHGKDALRQIEQHEGPIDLLLTDVVMPRMGGRELFRKLSGAQPDLKVVFVSGYTDGLGQDEVGQLGVAFLAKPFSAGSLTRKVREVLDGPPAAKDDPGRGGG